MLRLGLFASRTAACYCEGRSRRWFRISCVLSCRAKTIWACMALGVLQVLSPNTTQVKVGAKRAAIARPAVSALGLTADTDKAPVAVDATQFSSAKHSPINTIHAVDIIVRRLKLEHWIGEIVSLIAVLRARLGWPAKGSLLESCLYRSTAAHIARHLPKRHTYIAIFTTAVSNH